MDDKILREQLARTLDWHEAHATFDDAIADIPPARRGALPRGLPWSLWQLLEHIRRAQDDILRFCVSDDYRESKWPDDYWPVDPAPPNDAAWDESVRQVTTDRARLQALVRDHDVDLGAHVPSSAKHRYLREVLLAIDHTAYHVGQIVLVRRLLGEWKS